MEEGDKGCAMIRMGVSGSVFLLVPAYPGSPDQRPLYGCVCVCVCVLLSINASTALLLSGPVNTMLLNGREVGRAVMCSFDLAFNQTKTYMSLRIVPIIDILYQLQVR